MSTEEKKKIPSVGGLGIDLHKIVEFINFFICQIKKGWHAFFVCAIDIHTFLFKMCYFFQTWIGIPRT
jgi:hypothetical protein